MIQGIWIGGGYALQSLSSEELEVYRWIYYYYNGGPFIGRANFHHTLGIL